MPDRAVSNVLGFALVFALVVSSVGIVTVFGFSSLQNARDFEQVNNVERAFDVLADNLNDLHEYDAPNRATEVKLTDARLSQGESTRLTVEITNAGSPNPRFSTDTDPIVYTVQGSDTAVVYSNGAVVREEPEGAVMTHEPQALFTTRNGEATAMIPFIQTRVRSGGISGSSTVLIRAELASSGSLLGNVKPDASDNPNVDNTYDKYDVTLSVETTAKRGPVWDRYFDTALQPVTGSENTCTESGGTVTCSFSVHELYVTATRIDVSFQ